MFLLFFFPSPICENEICFRVRSLKPKGEKGPYCKSKMNEHCLCSSLPHTQKKKNNSLKRGAICHFPTYSAASDANSIFLKSSTPRVPVFLRMINAREFIYFRARYFFWGGNGVTFLPAELGNRKEGINNSKYHFCWWVDGWETKAGTSISRIAQPTSGINNIS